MQVFQNVRLSGYSSMGCGGAADRLVEVNSREELISELKNTQGQEVTVIGYGTNTVISDEGLAGTVIVTRDGEIMLQEDGVTVLADANVWWDDVVAFSVDRQLWGIELMSGIPGGVGGAVVGNIAAYGEAIADTLAWVEVFDRSTNELKIMQAGELELAYRESGLQKWAHLIVTRAAFKLSTEKTKNLTYQWALDYAKEHNLTPDSIESTRAIILGIRGDAASLYDWKNRDNQIKSAGSFFKNPIVSEEIADYILNFEESDRTPEQVKAMNKVHGGDSRRVSAAQVLLAAGYIRGQRWGDVRLHPTHILKLENCGAASAQNIADVALEIQQNVREKLDISLQIEAKFLGFKKK